MPTTEIGAELNFQPVAGRWGVSVPIPGAERQTEICEGPEHAGKNFRATELYAYVRTYVHGGEPTYKLFGPNLRQDGSEGAYRLAVTITRKYAAQVYPAASVAMNVALGELARALQADLYTATAEIQQARIPTVRETGEQS